MFPDSATANRVEGNWIGFDLSGQVYLMPNTDGVFLASSGNTVGGNTTAAQNIIIANNRDGVVVSSDLLDASNNALSAILNAEPVSERDRRQLHRHPGRRRRLWQHPRRRLPLWGIEQHDRRIVERQYERHLGE